MIDNNTVRWLATFLSPEALAMYCFFQGTNGSPWLLEKAGWAPMKIKKAYNELRICGLVQFSLHDGERYVYEWYREPWPGLIEHPKNQKMCKSNSKREKAKKAAAIANTGIVDPLPDWQAEAEKEKKRQYKLQVWKKTPIFEVTEGKVAIHPKIWAVFEGAQHGASQFFFEAAEVFAHIVLSYPSQVTINAYDIEKEMPSHDVHDSLLLLDACGMIYVTKFLLDSYGEQSKCGLLICWRKYLADVTPIEGSITQQPHYKMMKRQSPSRRSALALAFERMPLLIKEFNHPPEE